MEREHALEIVRARDEEVGGEDFSDDGAHVRQREVARRAVAAVRPAGRCRPRRERDVAFPAGQRAPFEVIEAEFVFEFLVLLLDRPALMRELDERAERRRRRADRRGRYLVRGVAPAIVFGEQPDFGRQPPLPPRVGRRDADRGEARRPRRGRPARSASGRCATAARATPRRAACTASGVTPAGAWAGRAAGRAGSAAAARNVGVPPKTLSVDETPTA